MIVRVIRLAEDDDSEVFRGMFDIFSSERFSKRKIKMHSELTWKPPADVIETAEELIVLIEISGMKGSEISVVTDGRLLKIRGVRKDIGPKEKKQFHKLEIPVGPFERVIKIPVDVDYKNVSATYENGMLKVSMKKLKPSDRVKRIEIE